LSFIGDRRRAAAKRNKMQAGQLIKKIKTVKFYKKRNQRNIYILVTPDGDPKDALKKGSK